MRRYAPDLTPIPTRWKGWEFRSRLEARWAVFFDALSIPFDYEAQGYQTDVGWYIPDFWLRTLKMFAEVKPTTPSREALAKCAAVAHGTGFPFVMLVETPDDRDYTTVDPSGMPGTYSAFAFALHAIELGRAGDPEAARNLFKRAIEAARGARFA